METQVNVTRSTYSHILGAFADAFSSAKLESQGFWAPGQLAYLCGQDSLRRATARVQGSSAEVR
jgi:hypothetical protein